LTMLAFFKQDQINSSTHLQQSTRRSGMGRFLI
jgi:hypothetical protein